MTTEELIAKLNAGAVGELYQVLQESEQRKAALEVLRAEVQELKALAEVDRASLNAQLRRQGDTVIALTIKNAEEKAATRRLCGEQVVLVNTLRALVDAVADHGVLSMHGQRSETLRARVKEAREVLSLVEVPFGG